MHDMFMNALDELLAAECTLQVVRRIEAGLDGAALWGHLAGSGFTDALVPEPAGGAGMTLGEIAGVLEVCGRRLLPIPLADTMWARGVLAEAGMDLPAGPIALARLTREPGGGLRSDIVRMGRLAQWILGQDETRWHLLCAHRAQASCAGHELDTVLSWEAAMDSHGFQLARAYDVLEVQACLTAPQIAGALTEVLQRTLAFANERVQFGKPIGKFQAIQHQLAVMAEEVFAAGMASRIGTCSQGLMPVGLRVAVAKGRTSEAALAVAQHAHAIHGAVGFTSEFDLQLFTRRLHVWRQAAGSEGRWHELAGRELLEQSGTPVLDLLRYATEARDGGRTQ